MSEVIGGEEKMPNSTRKTSLDATILKVDEFMSNILQIMEKKSTHYQTQRKIALLKISQMFLRKSLLSPHMETLTTSTSQLGCKSEGNNLHLDGTTAATVVQASPSNDALMMMERSLDGAKSTSSIIEEEFDDLSVLLFEEANKFVVEERKKRQMLQEQFDSLQMQLKVVEVNSCENIYNSYVSIRNEQNGTFKQLIEMQENERIFIDGNLLAEFQEFLGKCGTVDNNEGVESRLFSDKLIQSLFCKRIQVQLIDVIIGQFKAVAKSTSQKKRFLEQIQSKKFSISHRKKEPEDDGRIAEAFFQQCHLCGCERNCEFNLSIDAFEIHHQPIDRFCKHKLKSIEEFYAFLRDCFNSKPFQPLLVIYRKLVQHLHNLSSCILVGVVTSTDLEDTHYPNIEILN